MEIIVGIDYSSTNTGVCFLTTSGEYLSSILISPKHKIFQNRILSLKEQLYNILNQMEVRLINIESPSFYSKGKTSDISAGFGYLYYSLIKDNFNVISITPSELKKFATGNGRAEKDKMFKSLPKDVKID